MSDRDPYQSLDRLARRLPFPVDDFGQVNELFYEYVCTPARNVEVQIELWTYCFVRQYLTTKLVRDESAGGADLDALLDIVYDRIHKGRPRVRERYASWVSVVCRNSYLNYVRDRQRANILGTPADGEPDDQAIAPDTTPDALETIHAAIDRLPGYLQEVTRLRVLEEFEYDEIAALLNRPVTLVRSYVHRAIVRLRSDHDVCQVLGKPISSPEVMSEG